MSLMVGVLHYFIARAVNNFAEVFDEFGAQLPWITNLLVEGSLYYWIVPVTVGLYFLAHHFGYFSRSVTYLISSLTTIASIIVCVFALYLPIFQLGAVVR
ncbi:MAG: hypothetical protein AAF542_25555 [Pseudomonadota bacterium]